MNIIKRNKIQEFVKQGMKPKEAYEATKAFFSKTKTPSSAPAQQSLKEQEEVLPEE